MSDSGAKVAIVLSGGGAYGAFEVGVLKALCQGACASTSNKPFEPDIFTGTSVGSFNAAAMCMQPGKPACETLELLERIWVEKVADPGTDHDGNGVFRVRGNPVRILGMSIDAPARALYESGRDATFFTQDFIRRLGAFASGQGSIPRRAVGFVDISALLSNDPFQRMLEKTLHLEGIRDPAAKVLRIVATNWGTGVARTFSNEDMTEALGRSIVMASSAIPGIFPPVEIEKDCYVDGGVVMNTPLACAVQAGASELHVIYLDPDVSTIAVGPMSNTVDTLSRMYSIMLATKINEDIATAGWINDGLEVLERAEEGLPLTADDNRTFVRVAARVLESMRKDTPYEKLTIHRYNPSEDLGGLVGMLNFHEEMIVRLIQKGFESGLHHDCVKSGCLLPKPKAEAVLRAEQAH